MLEIPSRPFERDNIPFERLFNPRAIAVIGASINLNYGGSQYVFTIKMAGYSHPIYPVNPKYGGKELAGYKFYDSISSLPDDPPIDLAILAVPAKVVPSIIEELSKKKVPFAHIFSSGFAELGEEGKELEESIIKIASKHGVRILGPNCMGIHNPQAKITFLMMAADLTPGPLGFISQSGGIAVSHGIRAPSLGYHHSKIISVGNQIDLDIIDFLRFFKEDPETKVIAMYIENIKRSGHEFVQLLKETTIKKPVIIWKGGKFKTGVQAVMSHTGGLAGDFKMWEAMTRQTGAILVNNFADLQDQIRTCLTYPIPKTLSAVLMSGSGGFAVEMTDAVEACELNVPPLSKDAYEKINHFIPETNSNLKNPLEFGANRFSHRVLFLRLFLMIFLTSAVL